MEKKIKEREIVGHKLTCPVCKHAEFWTQKILINTEGMTLFGI